MNANTMHRLEKLNQLRSCGALTEEEFEAEKRKLLSKASSNWTIFAGACAAGTVALLVAIIWNSQTEPSTVDPLPPSQEVRAAPTSPPPPTIASRTPAERLAQAFEAATGHRRTFKQTAKGEEFTVTPIKILELSFGPVLLVKREIQGGCHGCSGFIGVYYLREIDGQPIVTASFPEAISGWGWGAAPLEWQVTDRFTASPAIYASGGYMGQGVIMSSAEVTELRPGGPITSDIIWTGYSDEGAITDDDPRPSCELTGKIANVVKDRSFEVLVSGTISGKDRYEKRRGKFVAVNKRNWDMPCQAHG